MPRQINQHDYKDVGYDVFMRRAATALRKLDPFARKNPVLGLDAVASDLGIADLTVRSEKIADIDSDLIGAWTQDQDAGGFKLTSLASATSAGDAFTLGQVRLLTHKNAVSLATDVELTVTYDNVAGTLTATGNGALSVDGTATTVGMRIVVTQQSTVAQNGIYSVTTVGDGSTPFVLTRTTDAATTAHFANGAVVVVLGGATLAGRIYVTHPDTFGVWFEATLSVSDNTVNEDKLTITVAGDGIAGGNGTPLSVDFLNEEAVDSGDQTNWTVSADLVAGSESVYVNGALKREGALNDYEVTGTGDTITFGAALNPGDWVQVKGLK